MCLSICWRLREGNLVGLDVPHTTPQDVVFWNHVACHPLDCPFADPHNIPAEWDCSTCVHRAEGVCGLTGAHLPAQEVCCHYNVQLPERSAPVCVRALLGYPWDVPLTHVLGSLNVAFTAGADACAGGVQVQPADMPHGVPNIYGQATTNEGAEEAADALGMPDTFLPSTAPGGPELGDSLHVSDVL